MEKKLRAIHQTFYQGFGFSKWDDASDQCGVYFLEELLPICA